jgi:aerobic-type carbon monoxide dehydrogenase small subunit (CoxS/CutS family)
VSAPRQATGVAIRFTINGEERQAEVEPRTLLSDFIRHHLGLTGTHVGCEHGVCGACTIVLNGQTVRSCLLFAVQVDGSAIETIEGLGASRDTLHPLQRAFWEHHGLQCGFCTPAMILAAKEFLEHNPDPSDEEIRQAIAGNICRCTGYTFIVEAIRAAAHEMANGRAADG